jgi:peptidoglycan hydrolase-like protein with peptidoglycan-binding domain
MEMATGRWVRRRSALVLLDVEPEGPFALEISTRPTLRRGAKGAAVRDLQARLGAMGFSPGAADGVFGAMTESAVRSFQLSRGLGNHGIVTPQTWDALDIAALAPTRAEPLGGQGVDPAIERLNLIEPARSGAYRLKAVLPWIAFTSGRRDWKSQARAMAPNVLKNRKWIAQTYSKKSAMFMAAQRWVDDNPGAVTREAVEAGLLGVFQRFPEEVARRSREGHFAGLAFDVRPVPSRESGFLEAVSTLPGVNPTQVFTKEGGLTIWHVGFFRPA